MSTADSDPLDDPGLISAAQTLLDAAHAYWRECARVRGGRGAIYVLGTDGALVIFTRGEERESLLATIRSLPHQQPDRPFVCPPVSEKEETL